MDPHSKEELLTALSRNDAESYNALIQHASVIDNDVLFMTVMTTSKAEALRAVLKHSSVNPFYNDNYLIHHILKHNMKTDFLVAILEHPLNQLTADHYRAFISASEPSIEKAHLLQSYLDKL